MPSSSSGYPDFPLPGLPDSVEAAFFDVDNTMMRGASLFAVARKMYQRKAFTLRQVAGFALLQMRFLTRGEDMKDIHQVRDRALALIAGFFVDDMEALGDEIYDEFIVSKIWPGTRAIANQHLNARRQVWLVTATPLEVASVMARRLGLSGALGTVVEQHDGAYTGRLVGEILHGPAKAAAVRQLAEATNLNLARCWAYSDSHNDIPLLEAVGHPVAINPDGGLRRHAKARNWPVYDFRTGRRAATLGLKAAGISGALWGLWRSLGSIRRR
ncbi:HAD family hydrolase [Paeniglutamicibacter cryotolerans]|uniref:HAD superfamily hydrolase (TIGR01490 family) n=1 Tax=Paeniglutamicibacter cryotolerans TaxID=670079 RepID=A0A839QF08_9MICC|nr:HAD-IB family hydrolase [Paeniglutamicibacter cryotolerans]MBB2994203.1 HAD superfamily hydrolase (TIGR01490 family) [Paeniglutamicibacter cryotolerans]